MHARVSSEPAYPVADTETTILDLEDPERRLEIGFRQAKPSEIDLIFGTLLLNRLELNDAFPYLYRAYMGLPDSPKAAA